MAVEIERERLGARIGFVGWGIVILGIFAALQMLGCSGAEKAPVVLTEAESEYPSRLESDVWMAPDTPKPEAMDGGVVDVEPKLTYFELPKYPILACAAGIEGVVFVEVIVGRLGEVKFAKIDSSTVSPSMEGAAMEVAWRFHYRPGMRGDEPIDCKMVHRIHFQVR